MKRLVSRLCAGVCALTIATAGAAQSTLIVNARVIDGTGAPARNAAVRIEGGKIAAIGKLTRRAGEQLVDAHSEVLSPGFIDTHSHHDLALFDMPDALPVTTQGVTTIIAGQDGGSALPVSDLFDHIRKTPVAVNVATYVGHNTIREKVLGEDYRRHATAEEIQRMAALVDDGMKQGALGLSTGLEYDPGIYSDKAEVLTLAKEAARFGGRYISHIRSEDQYLWAALDEIVEIGRAAKMPVQVSHMKLAMTDWWGEANRYLAVLDRERAAGVDISGDVYPYEYWQSTLTVMFPKRDFDNRASAEFALKHLAPAEGLLISQFSPEPALVGKTIAQIAVLRRTDPAETLMRMIAESRGPIAEESVIGTSMRADDVATLIAWPGSNISSDGEMAGRHPRGRGSFPRVIRLYVREQHRLTLEQAVHKMSGEAAAHMGIADRGVIRPGARADLILFDPATIADRATNEDPSALSVGVSRVWVNGGLVMKDGKATGIRTGEPVRRQRAAGRTM